MLYVCKYLPWHSENREFGISDFPAEITGNSVETKAKCLQNLIIFMEKRGVRYSI